MAGCQIDYSGMVERALREVVRDVLASVAEHGLPGSHHFVLTFATDHPDVEMSHQLRRLHSRELTIILQHQFWDLIVDEQAFEVTLRFDGTPHRLRIPYAALKAFVDPEARFGLRFETGQTISGEEPPQDPADAEGPSVPEAKGAKVVSFEKFRKRDDSS